MTAIETTNLKDKLCGGCDCTGFVPGVGYTIDAAAKTVAISDTSVYPATDTASAIIVHIYDKKGKRVAGKLTGGVAATANIASLDLANITINATVVSTKGCKADLSAFDLGVASLTGALANTALAGKANDSL